MPLSASNNRLQTKPSDTDVTGRLLDARPERAFLVGLDGLPELGDWPAETSLDELAQLVETAGAQVVGRTLLRIRRPLSATLMGVGQLDDVISLARADAADALIIDADLKPRQQRNLETAFKGKVLDRTGVILDIFAARAQTVEGHLQVERAQLEYLLPRLSELWVQYSRQRGGIGPFRGPGETQIETDRRLYRGRMAILDRRLAGVRARRARGRARRRESGFLTAALVGYTNAGKSSLLNALTGAGVRAEDRLFATLDPTTRSVDLPDGGAMLITDTVGFIQRLPTRLVQAFRGTLEEALDADVLIHVVDLASPAFERQVEVVHDTLRDIGAGRRPIVTALNKVDSAPAPDLAEYPNAVAVSATTGEGIQDLLRRLADIHHARTVRIEVQIPYDHSRLVALFHEHGSVEGGVLWPSRHPSARSRARHHRGTIRFVSRRIGSVAMTGGLRAGCARRDITPDPGIDLSGFGFRFGASLGSLEPLDVDVLAVTDSNQTLLLFSLDLIGLTLDHLAELRARTAAATGVPEANQMWTCTHTHGGPETGVLPGMGDVDPGYLAAVEQAALAAAVDALECLRPADLWWAQGTSYIGANRRSAAFRQGGPEDGHIDDIDPAVIAAEFRSSEENPIVTLVNYSCHPTGSRESVSTSDYPGHMRRAVSEVSGAPCLFVNGAGGDVNQRFDRSGYRSVANARRHGLALARTVLDLRSYMRRSATVRVAVASTPADLHYVPPISKSAARRILTEGRRALESTTGTAQRLRIQWHQVDFAQRVLDWKPSDGSDLTVDIQALRIGDLALVAIPSEFFSADGRALRAQTSSPELMVAGWSNGLVGYTPTRRAMATGGYEVDDAHRWYGHPAAWDPVSGDNLRAAALDSIGQLFADA